MVVEPPQLLEAQVHAVVVVAVILNHTLHLSYPCGQLIVCVDAGSIPACSMQTGSCS
jgi:hypothetical protein